MELVKSRVGDIKIEVKSFDNELSLKSEAFN